LELEEGDGDEEEACWRSSKEMRWIWCSSLASCSGDPPAKLGEVEGLQWWERGGSSSMAWLERVGWREGE